MFDEYNMTFETASKGRTNKGGYFQELQRPDEFDFAIQSPMSYPSIGPIQEELTNYDFMQNDVFDEMISLTNDYPICTDKPSSNAQNTVRQSETLQPFLSLETCEDAIHKIRSTL